MRTARLAVLFLLFPAILAAQQNPKAQISAFLTPESIAYTDSNGTYFDGGFGAAFTLIFNPRFSTELSVAVEQSYAAVQSSPGSFQLDRIRVESYPVDLIARYHFLNSTKWTPYVGGGVRYVSEPSGTDRVDLQARTSAEVSAGVVFQFTPRWGLRFDARQLLNEDVFYDAATKGSIGLSWSF